MTRVQRFLGIGLVLIFNHCACIGTKIYYDRTANFSEYKTYQWMADADKDVKDQEADDEVLGAYTRKAVDSHLAAKGYEQQMSADPDFLINYHAGVRARDYIDAVPHSYGYPFYIYGWGWGPLLSGRPYDEDTLLLDIMDARTRKLVWIGIAKAVVRSQESLDKREKEIKRAVAKILAKFPPKKK